MYVVGTIGSILIREVPVIWRSLKEKFHCICMIRDLSFCSQGRPFFDSVVLVVRNPFHALISEWNRELSTKYGLGKGNGTAHTNVYGKEYFRELLKFSYTDYVI